MDAGQIIVIIFALFGFIFLALCLGSGIVLFTKIWQPKVEKDVIMEGDRVLVRMFWSDERGNMIKSRHFIAWGISDDHKGDIDTSLVLVGNEEEDVKTRVSMGLPPKRMRQPARLE